MSQPSRPRAHGPARRKRGVKPDTPMPLEDRSLPAPIVPTFPLAASFTAATTPTNSFLGTVTVLETSTGTVATPAPITSVTELTPLSSFGGDMVRIKAGPGGDFGKGLYAISRGAGSNTGAVNRPGVIYRVDPATGKATVFFDLNTVLNQIDPNALSTDGVNPAANSLGASTGYVNWYDIAFDPEGYFDGKPSMFVSSSDRSDPSKNAIFRIAPDGTLMGAFVSFTDGLASTKFTINPTGMVVPGPEQQQFLRGLLAGSGQSTTNGEFAGLFFNSNQYSPGQVISNGTLPKGVSETGMTLGTIVGMTQANIDYFSPVYSAFTDFGTPAQGGIPARFGASGVQGSNGELLIGSFITTTGTTLTLDQFPAASSQLRRLQDIAFDQYGYFSQNVGLTSTTNNTGAGTGTTTTTTTFSVVVPPTYGGSLFVSDLAQGLSVTVTSVADTTLGIPAGVQVVVPVQGSGPVGITLSDPTQPYDPVTNPLVPLTTDGETTGGNLGGRVIRITPEGVVTVFASGFDTSGRIDAQSFIDSTLSITFSADGTTFYAADNDAVWQFKSTASLAGSTSGTLIGLNDLRTLGVPYEGQSSAVAVVDTGVDANSAPFRGRVAAGKNLWTGGTGNKDLVAFGGGGTTTGGGTGGGGGGTGGGGTGGTTNGGNVLTTTFDGHGTPVAGVVAQFVPQATILPVSIFQPFGFSISLSVGSGTTGGTGGGGGGTGGGGGGTGGTTTGGTLSGVSNALTTTNAIYNSLLYVSSHPYVNDPVRPGKVDRVIASTFAFGTTETFPTEAQAFKSYPQIVLTLKNAIHRFRRLGIAPIAATGQFGAPLGAGSVSSGTTGGTGGGGAGGGGTGGGGTGGGGTGGTGGTGSTIIGGYNNADNTSLGDTNGISLPAILNEVISVTGTYPFPYSTGPSSTPNDPSIGVIPDPAGPILVFGNALTIGGTAGTSGGGTGGGGGGTGGGTGGGGTGGGTTTGVDANVAAIAAADFVITNDQILGAVNRSVATDFAAPAIDVPTFRRTFSLTGVTGTGGTGGTSTSAAGDPANHLTFTEVGTSMSSAIVTGAYALTASALDYWINLAHSNGVTTDAYLTQPVGARSLNYGKHAIKDLSAYSSPDGINGILAYTAVPAFDQNNLNSLSTPLLSSSFDRQYGYSGGVNAPAYARVDIGNAIASIEGTVAIQYLLNNNIFPLIDTNSDGSITAQEIQNFTDTATTKGLSEAGAMARLLGGTATYAQPDVGLNNAVFNENPDQPGVLQRRFNYFDYLANGQLQGGITLSGLKMLAKTLLPQPDQYVIVDRQRASANGFLVDPTAQRNTVALQHLLPSYVWVPRSARASWKSLARYRKMSPLQLGVDRNIQPGSTFPLYTLFSSGPAMTASTSGSVVKNGNVNGETVALARQNVVFTPVSQTSTQSTGTTTTGTTTSTNTAKAVTTSTPVSTATTPATSTSSTDGSATGTNNNALAIVEALKQLALKQNAAGTTTPATPTTATPAGTVTPTTTTTTSAATTTDTTTAATSTPAATTTTQTAGTGSSTAATTSTTAANQQTAAAKARRAAAAKKKGNVFSDLWDSITKPF